MPEEAKVKLLHKKLDQLLLKSMKKLQSKEATISIPKLNIEEGRICGKYEIRKQTKMPHSKLHHQITSKRLETLHMALMEPKQVDSFGRKKYVGVIADDFSKSSWMNTIKEKSNGIGVIKEL